MSHNSRRSWYRRCFYCSKLIHWKVIGKFFAEHFIHFHIISHRHGQKHTHTQTQTHTHSAHSRRWRRCFGENFCWQLQWTPYYCLFETRLIAATDVQFIVKNRIHRWIFAFFRRTIFDNLLRTNIRFEEIDSAQNHQKKILCLSLSKAEWSLEWEMVCTENGDFCGGRSERAQSRFTE